MAVATSAKTQKFGKTGKKIELIDKGIQVKDIRYTPNISKTLDEMPKHWEYRFPKSMFNLNTVRSTAYKIQKKYWKMFSVITENDNIVVLRQR